MRNLFEIPRSKQLLWAWSYQQPYGYVGRDAFYRGDEFLPKVFSSMVETEPMDDRFKDENMVRKYIRNGYSSETEYAANIQNEWKARHNGNEKSNVPFVDFSFYMRGIICESVLKAMIYLLERRIKPKCVAIYSFFPKNNKAYYWDDSHGMKSVEEIHCGLPQVHFIFCCTGEGCRTVKLSHNTLAKYFRNIIAWNKPEIDNIGYDFCYETYDYDIDDVDNDVFKAASLFEANELQKNILPSFFETTKKLRSMYDRYSRFLKLIALKGKFNFMNDCVPVVGFDGSAIHLFFYISSEILDCNKLVEFLSLILITDVTIEDYEYHYDYKKDENGDYVFNDDGDKERINSHYRLDIKIDGCSKINNWDVDNALERLNGFRLILEKQETEEHSE